MTWFDQFARDNFAALLPTTPLRVLQVGVWTGDATQWLINNRDIVSITDVDCWDGPQMHGIDYEQAERTYDARFVDVHGVTKVRASSDDFFASNTATFDFVYVDGDHDPEQTRRDGVNGWACLAPSGILAFDDYEWELNGVTPRPGIDAALEEMPGHNLLLKKYQVWVRKP